MTLWDFDYCESLLCEAIVFKTRLAIVKDAKRKGKGGGVALITYYISPSTRIRMGFQV